MGTERRWTIAAGALITVGLGTMVALTFHRPDGPRIDPSQTIAPNAPAASESRVRAVYRPVVVPPGFEVVAEQGGAASEVLLPGSEGEPVGADPAAVYVLHYERAAATASAPPDAIDVLTIDRGPSGPSGPSGPVRPTAVSAQASSAPAGTSPTVATTALVETVSVHGRPARLSITGLDGEVRILTWDETEDVTIRIVTTGDIDREALLAMAESVAAQ
jgi:hypothetical protein